MSTTSKSPTAVGFIVFAGIMMMIMGVFQAFQGLAALFSDTFYVVGEKWVFSFDVTTWGWIHLLAGIVIALAGAFVLRGAVWARTIGVALAVVSSLLNFMWLPYYPIWAILIITVDFFVIWALTTHGRDLAA